jgi:hypothetical protein
MTDAQVKQSNPVDVRIPDIASYTNAVDEDRSRRTRSHHLRRNQHKYLSVFVTIR